MVRMSFIDLNDQNKQYLLAIARQTIERGYLSDADCPNGSAISKHAVSPALQKPRASFVTLKKAGELRGCIGTLTAHQPLLDDVKEHARASAFNDFRFPPVQTHELPQITISLSILGPAEILMAETEQDLLDQLRPGIDGLILTWPPHQATFLPVVWEQLTHPAEFLSALKQKAGLASHFWHPNIQWQRYQTLNISEDEQ
ncbi:Uncharacterised protein [BD1-7 clade bacterium]|uniref:AMMECR1 domain-containing protein n=1 Tax=BD1-7 clade bacterium TaxID=2029982 RepID=A0A5S9MU88_9GAMM|nr:Uncharacterised protein [BD1-7 clade bacterium]CAA0083647.1 Uncharacterised protein [BD1-7 clade bacterium]